MKVLLIDDKAEELVRAVGAAASRSWEAVVCNTSIRQPGHSNNGDWIKLVQEVDGVVADLMWDHAGRGEKPVGLLVVIHCLSCGKPVVVCTNAGEYDRGHHGEAISFIHDGYYASVARNCPFGWVENKDWGLAMHQLSERMGRK